ncbi:MAG: hypothetical protein ACJ72E_05420 [Marmoricola sp.]
MTTADDDQVPRHRKPGRAQKRGRTVTGRRVRNGPAEDCGCPPGFHEYGAHAPGAWPDADIATPPPGTYPVEDLAAMTPGAAMLLLHRAALESQAHVPAHPHIVIARDLGTDEIDYSGPFVSGLEALTAANDFLEGSRAADPDRRISVTVAPLREPPA